MIRRQRWTDGNDDGGIAPQPTRREVNDAIASLYRESMPQMFVGLAALLALGAFVNLAFVGTPQVRTMSWQVLIIAALLLPIGASLYCWQLPLRFVNPVGFSLGLVLLWTCVLPIIWLKRPSETIYLMLFVLMSGCISLSMPWLLAMLGLTGGICLFVFDFSWEGKETYMAGMAIAFVMAPIVAGIRIRGYGQLIRMEFAQRRREQTLRESELRFRTLAEMVPVLIVIHQKGKISYANRKTTEVVGYDPEELIGRDITEFVHPLDIDILDGSVQQMRAPMGFFRHELRALPKNGRECWLDVASSIMRIHGTESVLVCALDVTPRKVMEESLAASERKFRVIVHYANDVIFTILPTGQIAFVSPAIERLTGHGQDDLLGRPLDQWIHPEDRDKYRQAIAEIIERRRPQSMVEYRFRKEDGGWAWHSLTAAPLDNPPDPSAVVGVAKDVTDRVAAEEEQREMQRQILHTQKLESLGVLAGGIAHDFNNLLVGILGNAGLLSYELPEDSPDRESLREIEIAATRAADLCRQMLAYSGRGRFVIETLNLSKIVEEIGELLKASISKTVVLRDDLDRNLPAIDADAAQIQQVVMNLITNASEAVGAAFGEISVRTRARRMLRGDASTWHLPADLPPGLYVSLEVSDTGCGMDAATSERIFEPFFTTKFTGRGLGMATVLGIVRGHKGAIRCETCKGRGTTFEVVFPASLRDVTDDLDGHPEDVLWQGEGTVLVVDDDDAVRRVAKRVLERGGFHVLTAVNGLEGCELFEEHVAEISLVLLDMTMPQRNGEETLRAIRRLRDDVPVILSSGYSEEETIELIGEDRRIGFLQKPYPVTRLWTKVRSLLGPTMESSIADH